MSEETQPTPPAAVETPSAPPSPEPQTPTEKAAPVVVKPQTGIDPDRYAEARAMATKAAEQNEQLKAQLAENQAQMSRALELAKRNAKLAALPHLANEQYLALAPDVQLDDSGALTSESREALAGWQKEHRELFKKAPGGLTPGVEGGEQARKLTDDQLMLLASAGVRDVERWKRNVPQAVINKIQSNRKNKRV
jgi:hypothetical protein